jgi:hypothetical protein
LASSVELRRRQLEHDIQEYIKLRQAELREYEQEVLLHVYLVVYFACRWGAETGNRKQESGR